MPKRIWALLLMAMLTATAGISLAVPAMSFNANPHMSYGMSFNAPHATLAMSFNGSGPRMSLN